MCCDAAGPLGAPALPAFSQSVVVAAAMPMWAKKAVSRWATRWHQKGSTMAPKSGRAGAKPADHVFAPLTAEALICWP